MDFLSPQDPNAGPMQPTVIDQLLSNPRVAAGVLQFGINATQPRAWGQSPFSALTSAVGGGAEAAQRQEAEDIKQQEANSKEDLRASQATAAEARAGAAGARNDMAAQRLAYMQDALAQKKSIADQTMQLNLHRLYQKRVKDITDSTPIGKKPVIPTPEEFFNSIGVGHIMSGGSGVQSEDEAGGGAPPSTTQGETSRPPGRYTLQPGGQVGYWDGKNWHF